MASASNERRQRAALMVLLSALGLLTGCATMDRDECRSADWRTVGYQDGTRGKPASEIGRYREDCAEHGVSPNLDAYTAGRAQGLGEYCRPHNGFYLGQRGRAYRGVCPVRLDGAFRAAYKAGRELHDLNKHINEQQKTLDARAATLKELEQELAQVEAELIADGVSKERRAELLQHSRDLDGEIASRRRELSALQRKQTQDRARLDQLQRTSPYL